MVLFVKTMEAQRAAKKQAIITIAIVAII